MSGLFAVGVVCERGLEGWACSGKLLRARARSLDALHRYWQAGVFNLRHHADGDDLLRRP